MIEIMLQKFFWTYQKNHAIENHTMENHVRRGLTVLFLYLVDASCNPPQGIKKTVSRLNADVQIQFKMQHNMYI